jgi:hypothetical protein
MTEIKFFTGPKQMGDVRRLDFGKVPSIYGPSADEPWM